MFPMFGDRSPNPDLRLRYGIAPVELHAGNPRKIQYKSIKKVQKSTNKYGCWLTLATGASAPVASVWYYGHPDIRTSRNHYVSCQPHDPNNSRLFLKGKDRPEKQRKAIFGMSKRRKAAGIPGASLSVVPNASSYEPTAIRRKEPTAMQRRNQNANNVTPLHLPTVLFTCRHR